MVTRERLVKYLDDLLVAPVGLTDPSNNGLQVEGTEKVQRVVFGVDACHALFEAAMDDGAQFIVVHHGISWGNGFSRIVGADAHRLRLLFTHGISLYASHIPLDCHPRLGNNAVLADLLNVQGKQPFGHYGGIPIGFQGKLPEPVLVGDLVGRIEERLGTRCKVLQPPHGHPIETLGIISGGGADIVTQCSAAGVQCLLTGEIAHQHVHLAREAGIPVIAAGHYITETTGPKALMAEIEAALPVSCRFVDLPTGY